MFRRCWEWFKEISRLNAVKRLFAFVEVRKSEVAGLVGFAMLMTLFEGVGISLILPILQFVEGGQSAIQDSTGVYWQIFADILAYLSLEPTLIVLLLLAFIPIILRNVTFYLKSWYGAVVTSRIMLRMRMKIVDVVYSADPEFYSRNPVGQLVGVVMGQTASAGNAVLTVIGLIGILLMMSMYLTILLVLSWQLTLVALLFAALVTLVNRRVLNWIAANSLKNARLSQRLMGKITERMGQMKLVKLRFTKVEESENIRHVSEVMRGLGIRAARVNASVEVIIDPLQLLSVFTTLYIGITFLNSTLAQLVVLLFILTRLNAKVRELNGALRGIKASVAGVTLTREMYDSALESNTIQSGGIEYKGLKDGIEIRDVHFAYPHVRDAKGDMVSCGKTVLKGVNATIPAGSFTAIVGRSGAGKSTLVELLPRMRDVDRGEVLFDGINIKEFDVKSIRRSIGYVTQTPMLFNDTVWDNVTYGLGYEPTEEQVRVAMDAAHASFVYDLPRGLETKIGDSGVRFSGGERQRISLARVLLQDTDVLVFDEPTSSLDSESEGFIQDTLSSLHGEKTLVVIAHRLSTIVSADQLLVVDDGKVVEIGSHQDLLNAGGLYAQLFESQLIGLVGTEESVNN